MRAWQFSSTAGGLQKNLKLNSTASLPPSAKNLAADNILVQVITASLNPADYKVAEIPLVGRFAITKPSSPGMDYAGRIVALGAANQHHKPGQLVFGRLKAPQQFGTLAEYIVVESDGCVPLPKGVKPDDAAGIGTAGLTAYQSIVPFVKAGQRVFINGGSGGTGVYGIQIAKAVGCHVVTSCSTPNIDLCKSLGADEVIDYRNSNVVAELKKMTNFDLVVDNVTTPRELYWEAPLFTNPGATFVQVGGSPDFHSVYTILSRRLWPTFLGGGKRPFVLLLAQSKPDDYKQIAEWMQQGKVKTIIAERFGMENEGPVKAFDLLKTGRAKGKILVRISEADNM